MPNPRDRWPATVFDGGEEPDPRFSLANIRTLLAWLRTALALQVGGVTLGTLDLPMPRAVQAVAGVVALVLSILTAAHAWTSWARTERALRRGQGLPGASDALFVIAGVVLLGALLFVGLVLGER